MTQVTATNLETGLRSLVQSCCTTTKENPMTRSKIRPCALCKRRPRSTHVIGPDLCDPCHEYAGWENTHQDEGHDDLSPNDPVESSYTENCPVCLGTPPPWTVEETTVKTKTRTTTARNPQTKHMSHASCAHPRTPAGRAACRKTTRTTPSATPKPQHVKIGKGVAVHAPGGCVTVQRWSGDVTRTDEAVTCKNCLKSTS